MDKFYIYMERFSQIAEEAQEKGLAKINILEILEIIEYFRNEHYNNFSKEDWQIFDKLAESLKELQYRYNSN